MRPSPEITFEREADAIAIAESDTFRFAIRSLRERYYTELMAAPMGTLTATAAHAKLVALEDIPKQLGLLITEAKMSRRQ